MSEMQSPTIGALVAALAKAKTNFEAAVKDSLNPHFKSKYADLDTVVSATTPALSANGLVVVQMFDGDNLVTMLAHSSGEWIKGTQPLHAVKMDPQGVAGASTYARRYGHMAICGIAPEDDDGNTAQKSYLEAKAERPKAPAKMELYSVLTVASVECRTSSANKPYAVVTFGDGSTATTFSSTVTELAQAACADKRAVQITVEPKEANGKHYYNIKDIK